MAQQNASTPQYTELPAIPSLGSEYRNALRDVVPGFATKRKVGTPATAFAVSGVHIDRDNMAAYCRVCRLRVGTALPITYPYTVTFPLVMKVMTAPDFPFSAVGTVHLRNVIEQHRPILVTEELSVRVHAENVRRHPKGLLIDLITEISAGGDDLVWRQVSTMLSLGKFSEKDGPLEQHTPLDLSLPEDPTASVSVSPSEIKAYAAVSGDRNPIHVSRVGAKAFGFPKTIAHGMWTAASLLSVVEGAIPDAVRYTVEFGKPVFLPAKLSAYSSARDNGWDLRYTSAKDAEKIHVSARIEEL